MFGYNVLSDLKTGELVTPLRKENGQIICLTQSGLEAVFDFEDFDFDKAPEERVFVVIDPDDSEDSSEESSDDSPSSSSDSSEDSSEENFDDSSDNSSDDDTEKERWITDNSEKIEILNKFGYTYSDINKVNIIESPIL